MRHGLTRVQGRWGGALWLCVSLASLGAVIRCLSGIRERTDTLSTPPTTPSGGVDLWAARGVGSLPS